MDYDRTDMPETYQRGRDHGPEVLQQWMDAVAVYAPSPLQCVLDLGCGTGRFSQGLVDRLDTVVVGIDPSRKMLAEARRSLKNARLSFVSGTAEALPLHDAAIDLIFISMAFHHFADPKAAARECSRVLRHDGRIFMRTGSRDMIPTYPYVPFFPSSRAILERRLPTLAFQQETFEECGFKTVHRGVITQQIAMDQRAYADKLAMKADSVLIELEGAEFDAGLEALRSSAANGPKYSVAEIIDVFVFRKT